MVGVCSADGGSESVGEVSESVGRWGDVMTLRSYSSSASESAWYAVPWKDISNGLVENWRLPQSLLTVDDWPLAIVLSPAPIRLLV